jgi:hypothetical protein
VLCFAYLPFYLSAFFKKVKYCLDCKSDFVTSGSGGGLGIVLEGAFGSVFHSSW